MTIKEKSQTDVLPWTLKGIDVETRVAVQKAAKKEGATLGKYCNQKLREAANQTLKGNTLPIKPEDVRDEVKAQIESLKQDLAFIVKETIQQEKAKDQGLIKRIFG